MDTFKRARTRRLGGFTIIEMLVVTGIIALLVGILLPALSGVKKRSRKTAEMNAIKQVGHAWNLYGTNNNDAALPGYLSAAVQAAPVPGISRGWAVNYQYPDRTNIVPGVDNLTGPWPWRLLSYLDYNHELIHGYAFEEQQDVFTLQSEAKSVAYEPAFGYNGYYVGGWWDMTGSGPSYPVFQFYDHCSLPNATSSEKTHVTVPTTISQIQRSSEMVTFCSSAKFNEGTVVKGKLREDYPGSYIVTPPILADKDQWQPDPGNSINNVKIMTNSPVYCPIGRHTGAIAVLWADGHCDPQSFNALYDQYKWVNSANYKLYRHTTCAP